MDAPPGTVAFTPSRDHFPFESRWFESSVGPVHYIDEGAGRPILFLHGNPDWSFLYRKIVLALGDRFRCIALDYPGFGLSAHPDGYGYTAQEHASVTTELVERLDLQDMIVMGQDWGGPIGMSVAGSNPDRVGGLVMGNTWYWPEGGGMTGIFSRIMGSWPVQRLILRRNLFVSPLMKRMIRAELSDAEFDHYRSVVPTPESRRGIAEFPKQILDARPWLAEVEVAAQALTEKPILLLWGMKDPAFGRGNFLARWQEAFPEATLLRLPDAGHYIQEDAPQEIAEAILAKFAPEAGAADASP
jgi:haloalkane dehalogenase